jgi:hypothetical protein
MAPRRPRSHTNADKSVIRLIDGFVSAGWTAEGLEKDYGEDLLVRIFEGGEATQYCFFVQAKATDNIERYRTRDASYIKYPFDVSHLEHWSRFWEPVILALWDAQNDTIFWEVAQSPERVPISSSSTRAQFFLPCGNRLDSEGLRRIASRVKSRFGRFEQEQHGADVLVGLIEGLLDVKITYNSQFGIVFVEHADGNVQTTVFGKAYEQLARLAKEWSTTPEAILETMVTKFDFDVADNGEVTITGPEGQLVERWENLDRLVRDAQLLLDLHD